MTVEYTVRLESFEGPLDLLLYLIRKAEVEITDIPIAAIADQYLEFLQRGGVERIDIETAGEFLVMAATLMEIKSRVLTPRPEAEADTGPVAEAAAAEDPRSELVRQLLAYKQFRDAADALEARREEWERRYPSARAGIDAETFRAAALAQSEDLDLDDLSVLDLAQAFADIAASVNFDRLGEHEVTYDDTPIELHAEDILERLRTGTTEARPTPGMTLQALFSGRKRHEMVGLFLATLELVKRRAVRLSQGVPGGPIVLSLGDDAGDVVDAGGASGPA